jgi:ubiquinone/menaquinone biosynthesis C-methylase UbiE
MSSFEQSRWADAAFAQNYLEHADHFIPDRQYLFHVMRSLYRAFVARAGSARPVRICDLGCGDGVLTEQLLREDSALEATLVDGSGKMLEAARARLEGRGACQFVERSFAAVSQRAEDLGPFDLVVSSFAIHHLSRAERQQLFSTVHGRLVQGGWFLNIEATLPDHPVFTEWYYELWREWIRERSRHLALGDRYDDIPKQARENPDNQYSSMADQLEDLRDARFREAECHYKNGVFAIYTARR